MSIQDKFKPYIKFLKLASVAGTSGIFVAYHIFKTYKSLGNIINPSVLDREKKYTPEYIYIEDPSYNIRLTKLRDGSTDQSVGLLRLWKSLKHSLAWRLLWLCRHGNREQRNIALEQLAAFKTNKDWDCLKLAQALDKNTAVLLARTQGADLRYFLPPPIHIRRAAKSPELLSFRFRDMILAVQNLHPHGCIQHFLSKYFTNVQDQAVEADSVPSKPDSISERELCIQCLDALHHHISLFYSKSYDEDDSAKMLVKMGLLNGIAELFLRYKNDADVDLAVVRLLTVISIHNNLLKEFFENGVIGYLSRLIRSKDVRLSSSSAVCLVNLSGEYCYRPGLFLLHPIYRTIQSHTCDTLLVHGLRGGVFVTWRQRDKKCAEPIGIIDVTTSDVDCDPCEETINPSFNISDPDLRQVIEDLIELEDESLLSDLEVVLHDLPITAKRETSRFNKYTANKKRIALIEEEQDSCNYTLCWPKDWLPKDCKNLRILGVNYWSSLSEWLERCPLQTAEIGTRAAELAPALIDAGVGSKGIPVVWLAHSMGGLIVKQLLIDAANNQDIQHKKLSENTKAVLFYSTPHKGSALATMPRAAAAVLWPSNDVRQLQINSPILLDINKAFIKIADTYNWETISFAETKPTLVTAFKVPIHFVESISADLGRGVFYELPLDHLSICKPATRQSILYTTVLEVLHRAMKKNEDLQYSNILFNWLASFNWWSMKEKAKDVLDTLDDSNSSSGLRWFEQALLDVFTDGFTD